MARIPGIAQSFPEDYGKAMALPHRTFADSTTERTGTNGKQKLLELPLGVQAWASVECKVYDPVCAGQLLHTIK